MRTRPSDGVNAAKAKGKTKARPKADSVAKKAAGTRPKSKQSSAKAAAAVVKKEEPKTVTFTLPAGARRVDNAEVPDILKGVPGVTVAATYVFDVPVSLSPTRPNPANVGADNGPKGSLGWVLGNAHAKIDGEWAVSDADVDRLKAAVRPLMERVLEANGVSAAGDAKISLPDGFRDPLGQLEEERANAGLESYADQNYYAVHITLDDGRVWETAVHPKDLS